MKNSQIVQEQLACLAAYNAGKPMGVIAEELNLSRYQVRRRISGAKKRERLDPELARQLAEKGIVDLAGLHSGWLLEKDKQGSGHSLYFYLGPDGEKISFADAVKDVLSDILQLPPIKMPDLRGEECANNLCLADLHVGGDYGDPQLEEDFTGAIDDIVSRLPPAEHAVFLELGDLLEANDHRGVTPASENPLDVVRSHPLKNTMTAIRLCRHAIYRLLETHVTVEVHLIKGNHDPTAYIGVLLALTEHFSQNPRVNVVVSNDEYRVIPWGACATFPHHGDTLKWEQLKDVWSDQFPDEWALAKADRHIVTAHYHHDRRRDLVGATAEHFRTLHRPNNWAKGRGLFSRGSLVAMTKHKRGGEINRTISNISNILRGL